MQTDKKKIGLVFLLIIAFLPIVIATPSFYVEQNEDYDLKISCFNDDSSFCLATIDCTITVLTPNNTLLVHNESMTYNIAFYNYTIHKTNTSELGEYPVVVQCAGLTDGFQTFSFEITEDGNAPPTETNTRMYFFYYLLAASIVFLILGFWREDATFMNISGFGFVITGIFIAINGFVGLDNLMTQFLMIALWGIGFYIILRTNIELLD